MSEKQLLNLKRKLVARRSKIEAMLFELQELNRKISKLTPDNSDVIVALKELSNKVDLLELNPNIQVESKEVKVEPNIKVNSPKVNVEVNQEEVIKEIKELKGKINSEPNSKTNVLISDLINKVEMLELKPQIKVESKEVKVEPIFDPKIEVKPAEVNIEKIEVQKPINWLYKSLSSILSPFIIKVSNFINKMVEYMKEPNRVIISDDQITEYYGEKQVVYKIKDDGRKLEITKE